MGSRAKLRQGPDRPYTMPLGLAFVDKENEIDVPKGAMCFFFSPRTPHFYCSLAITFCLSTLKSVPVRSIEAWTGGHPAQLLASPKLVYLDVAPSQLAYRYWLFVLEDSCWMEIKNRIVYGH